jgi:hypothetical protein
MPGPPFVSTTMTSTIFNISIDRMMMAVIDHGASIGKVIFQNTWTSDTVSRRAASSTSSGTALRPARRISMKNGVHCQVSMISTVMKAR